MDIPARSPLFANSKKGASHTIFFPQVTYTLFYMHTPYTYPAKRTDIISFKPSRALNPHHMYHCHVA